MPIALKSVGTIIAKAKDFKRRNMKKTIHYLQVKISKYLYLDFLKANINTDFNQKEAAEEALRLFIEKYGKK
jgi:hypothetical protein